MSTEENKAIVRRYIEEMGKGNFDIADELVAPEFNEAHPERSGPEGEKRLTAFYHTILPGVDEIEDMIAEADRVVVHLKFSGTHEGEWRGAMPTGKPFTIDVIQIYRVSGGKITGNRFTIMDELGFLKQVGLYP